MLLMTESPFLLGQESVEKIEIIRDVTCQWQFNLILPTGVLDETEIESIKELCNNEEAVVVIILLHIADPNIDVVHNVFSDSALGDDTST